MTVEVQEQDFTAKQGATFNETLTYGTGDPTIAAGAPGAFVAEDLTGCSAKMQIRQTYATATIAASLTTDNEAIILGGTAGTIELLLTAAQTQAMYVPLNAGDIPTQTYVYDLFITFPSGEAVCVCFGNFVVTASVTRS